MRVVAGRHRGRHIEAPEGLTVRPTADRTREAMFNILERGKLPWPAEHSESGNPLVANPLIGAWVLDAFAGTGALGLEAVSRGAAHVTFMENQAAAAAACRDNIETLGEQTRCEIVRYDVLHPPRAPRPCDLVLMDPPYGQGLATPAIEALRAAGWIAPGTLVIVELMAKEEFPVPNGFATVDTRKYGKARLEFLRAED